MTLLIDADWLIYNSCCACEQDTRWNEWEHTLHSDERDILQLIDNRLDIYKSISNCHQICILLLLLAYGNMIMIEI